MPSKAIARGVNAVFNKGPVIVFEQPRVTRGFQKVKPLSIQAQLLEHSNPPTKKLANIQPLSLRGDRISSEERGGVQIRSGILQLRAARAFFDPNEALRLPPPVALFSALD